MPADGYAGRARPAREAQDGPLKPELGDGRGVRVVARG